MLFSVSSRRIQSVVSLPARSSWHTGSTMIKYPLRERSVVRRLAKSIGLHKRSNSISQRNVDSPDGISQNITLEHYFDIELTLRVHSIFDRVHRLSFYLQASAKRETSNDGEESPKSVSSFVQDKDFILDCLCWHNEYRARHSAPALTVSPEVSGIL